MNQYKPVFQGTVDPTTKLASLRRAVNTQKCIRAGGKHNDLEDVGKDTYHHTFFEMLGNWSFGDYFKKEAIEWAWNLLTDVFHLDPHRLYATYFGGDGMGLPADEEARDFWLQYLPSDRVLPFGMKDNFWEMGETGPCGPCSEVHYDRIGGRCAMDLVNMDDPTVIEIWNIVFIQFNREANGSLSKLPSHHIDTGLGLERLVSVLQEKTSNYDTDVFTPILSGIRGVCGCRPYAGKVGEEDTDRIDMAYRVVSDHIRTLSFAIVDGCVPSNEGRGYVLRRILRRAVRYGREILKAPRGFFSRLVPYVVETVGEAFPELRGGEKRAREVIEQEEESFMKTLDRGIRMFDRLVARLRTSQESIIPGHEAFKLYDTYGFPVDLTELMAEEHGLTVDMDGYGTEMEKAKELSRQGGRGGDAVKVVLEAEQTDKLRNTMQVASTDDSLKYTWTNTTATVQAILTTNREFVTEFDTSDVLIGLIFDRTNFYAESGGQVADLGTIETPSGLVFEIEDVRAYAGYVVHSGRVVEGKVCVGSCVTLSVDYDRRLPIAANHTATHILNFALRDVLKEDCDQKGSLVADDRLRFDFARDKGVSATDLGKIESLCRKIIYANTPVFSEMAPLSSAQQLSGLRAVFGETYPDPVRVLSVGTPVHEMLADPANPAWRALSIEFCGGTHLDVTGKAEEFALISEEAIAKGIRRIVALTREPAKEAIKRGNHLAEQLERVASLPLSTREGELAQLQDTINRESIPAAQKEQLQIQATKVKKALINAQKARINELAKNAGEAARLDAKKLKESHPQLIIRNVDVAAEDKALETALNEYSKAIPEAAIFVLSSNSDKVAASCCVPEALAKKLDASEWVSQALAPVEGRGGGKGRKAKGQGRKLEGLPHVESEARTYAMTKLSAYV
eukprot:TRINITY_DN23711_c0_g1_i1.p1 TRINITY_DN23711_c0_g1~~TRINITY_DN23711_c0_g1_i1.p1  ORF type:complete len:963 (+),score=243.67 TRINITY_DN23711_c0_g1_i1:171-2891(+)